ncbi:MAG: type II toxin-antitoxin system VapC family toxin [Spirochaetales bacterium]|nr:type II toxin-antitoxin system VapC family toxin [Spirochaetales bacterium]
MHYLTDTNIISEIMKKQPDVHVYDWFSRQETIYFSVITVEEIYFGLSRKNLVQKLAWFQQFSADKAIILEITDKISSWSGEKCGEMAAAGKIVTMADSLIAATAHDHGLILATRNIKDFQHFGIAVLNPFSID